MLLVRERGSEDCAERSELRLKPVWHSANRLQPESVRCPILHLWHLANDSDRTKRVKDAKNEAQKEIEEYRKKKEEEYKKFESEVSPISQQSPCNADIFQQSSGNKTAEDEANKEADVKLKEIDEAGKKSGSKVVDDLIKVIITPRPEVPDKVSQED